MIHYKKRGADKARFDERHTRELPRTLRREGRAAVAETLNFYAILNLPDLYPRVANLLSRRSGLCCVRVESQRMVVPSRNHPLQLCRRSRQLGEVGRTREDESLRVKKRETLN